MGDIDIHAGSDLCRGARDAAGRPSVGRVVIGSVRAEELSVDECLRAVRGPGVGAVALFVGTVRDHDHGCAVTELEYTAHPRAGAEIARVAAGVAAAHPVLAVAVTHRTGLLGIGDIAVVVAVGAAHRDEAFVACRHLIDEVKAQVPIWKRQVFTDGSSEWVGAC
ncbi:MULTISPECIES: molybdenum cofactor biosynthesis protein MoaE [Protofrankia]|uniref:Molybdopterin biosynthesis MoaE protein n=1 Tax=Candidatus Protofrankia datiscae TaxID=2716812 RepID=F8AX89_9ACTN|nr:MULTISPECIES: molybdenum cofactor biosynthesis protein MoaE [Protofrankia]AEH08439.1 molybdopterin biosynthesis MoaE protein [Candidatus Protofrankia datiscae]